MTMSHIDTMSQMGDRATIAGAGLAGLGWMSASEFAAIVGAIVALGGLIISWYYKRAANARLDAEHHARMREQALRLKLLQERHGTRSGDDLSVSDCPPSRLPRGEGDSTL